MNASHHPLVRVENLLRCWGGSAVDSIALVISDSPMLLSLLQHNAGADDYMPLELYSELTFEPPGIELLGHFNRASGHRLREILEASIGKQWRWLPPRRRRNPWYSGSAGRVIIPAQRLWSAWDDAEPHPATAQDIQAFAKAWPPVDGTQGFCNDKLLVMHVARSMLDETEADAQRELLQLVADCFAQPRKKPSLTIKLPIDKLIL